MKRKGNVIAIMSPKGGAGKTVTSVNVALALALSYSKRILLIDTNITTASLGFHLNILYPKITIYDVLKTDFYIAQAIHHYNENLDVIPATITIEKEDKDFSTMEERIRRIVNHYDILLSTLVKKYDLVILDSAPGFNQEAFATMQVADCVLFVANPEYPTIAACVKAVEYAKLLKVPMGGIILNKVRNRAYETSKEEIEKALGIKVLQKIPFEEKVSESIARKIPIVVSAPYNRVSTSYKQLAGILIGQEYELTLLERFKSFINFFK